MAEPADLLPLKIMIVEMEIAYIRDVMFYGSKFIAEPCYEKTYDLAAAAKLDPENHGGFKTRS